MELVELFRLFDCGVEGRNGGLFAFGGNHEKGFLVGFELQCSS